MTQIDDAVRTIRSAGQKGNYDIGLIPGSDISSIVDGFEDAIKIPYSDIQGFQTATLNNRSTDLVIGRSGSKTVVSLTGRFYYFNGCSMSDISYPIQVMAALGIKNIIVTCSAGGINETYRIGDVMVISDHLNLMGNNPLFGTSNFMNMSKLYDPALIGLAEDILAAHYFNVHKGVYAGLIGPIYETPAELKMLRILGADAVGMSVVPEAIAAKAAGIKLLAYARITDLAVPQDYESLSHELIIRRQALTKQQFINATKEIISAI